MTRRSTIAGRFPTVLAALALACAALALAAAPGRAAEGVAWRSEQPTPPGSSWPIGLGTIGDIEFWTPPGSPANRGLLITAGSPPTVPAGVWAYNGVQWHPLSTVCGATDGRIAWAGPEEFWTVSDGRSGQTGETGGTVEKPVPHEDNTLCHFAGGQVVASYAHPAFEPDSYQAMHGAACLSASDCWFAGDPLEEPQIGAFHLHWNGGSLEAQPYPGEGHAVEDLRASGGRLYESVRVSSTDRVAVEQPLPPVVHRINPAGVPPVFEAEGGEEGLPLYGASEQAKALDALHLSSVGGVLWAAAGRNYSEPVEPEHMAGQVTLATRSGGTWTQLIGPEHPLGPILPPEQEAEEHSLLGGEAKDAVVTAVAAEPGSESAWIALKAPEGSGAAARAVLIHVSAEGELLGEQTLPSASEQQEGIGPKGAGVRLSCPAANDCWLATTQGWLFHMAPENERTLPLDSDPNFNGLITFRPEDLGLPQVPPDAPPPDTSGLIEEPPNYGTSFSGHQETGTAKVTLPLLSRVHSRLIKGFTYELRFHLAVKARVRLVAKRRRKVVAATRTRTFAAGNRKLVLRLNPRRWPTKLDLQTHALAPLPVVSSVTGPGANVPSVSTRMVVLPRNLLQQGSGLLP